MVGLVGLRGAGHEEIGRSFYGSSPFTGSILLNGQTPDLSSPRAAMKSGVGLVARDRVVESIAPSLTIRENSYINPEATGRSLLSFMPPRREDKNSYELGKELGLSPNDPTLAIEALSGGNQQKVVVGRWLATGRKLLIAEDPTAGVDVAPKLKFMHFYLRLLQQAWVSLLSQPILKRLPQSATEPLYLVADKSSTNCLA